MRSATLPRHALMLCAIAAWTLSCSGEGPTAPSTSACAASEFAAAVPRPELDIALEDAERLVAELPTSSSRDRLAREVASVRESLGRSSRDLCGQVLDAERALDALPVADANDVEVAVIEFVLGLAKATAGTGN